MKENIMANPTTGTRSAQENLGQAGDKAREAAGKAGEAVQSVAKAAGHAVDSGAATVGGGVESLGHTIRRNAPSEGVIGSAAGAVASGLENTGQYLQEKGVTGMMNDLTETIKRNPMVSILIAMGLGYLLARATRG